MKDIKAKQISIANVAIEYMNFCKNIDNINKLINDILVQVKQNLS